MPLNTDILFLHYRDEVRKSEMETKRFFTYSLIAPHINTKKVPYSRFMRFEWEKQKTKKNAKEYLNNEDNIRKMKEFINSKPLEKPLTDE